MSPSLHTVECKSVKMRRPLVTLLALLVLLLAPQSDTLWADEEEDPPAPDAPAPEEPAPKPAPDDDKPSGTATEGDRPTLRKVYVPFRDLKKIFEKEGEGVFLPYAEFRRLWERANPTAPDTATPPVPVAVRSAAYKGIAEDGGIRFEATLEIEVLADGWQRLPLPFSGIGIESATLDGTPALMVPAKAGYELLVKDKGRRVLVLALRVGAPVDGDSHKATFGVPPAPLSKMELVVPGLDTDVDITPRLASTSRKRADGQTELLAFLGPTGKVSLRWRRRPEDAPTVKPLLFATEETHVRVDRGVLRTTLRARLSILRAPLERLRIVIPEDAAVLFVQGEGIRSWRRTSEGNALEVDLREPRKEQWEIAVGLERPLPPPPAEVDLPLAFLAGMERERGFLRLDAAEGMKVEPLEADGLIQIDAKDLPKALAARANAKVFAWRHPARPGGLRARVEALEPRIHANIGTRVGIRDEGLDFVSNIMLEVSRAGIFGAEVVFDGAVEITDVVVGGVELDDYQQRPEGDSGTRVTLAFRDRLLGNASLIIKGRARLAVPEAEGEKATVPLPIAELQAADHVRGYLVVHVEEALDRKQVGAKGLTVLDQDAPGAVEPAALPVTGQVALPQVFRFEHREGDLELSLELTRKEPMITAAVHTGARFEPDRTRLSVTVTWNVSFRGVDSFRFRAPLAGQLASRLKSADSNIQLLGPIEEARPPDAGDDWEATHGIWTVKLPAPRTGAIVVPLVIEDQEEGTLTSGAQRVTTLPAFVPVEVDESPLPNTVFHVSVERDALLQIAPETIQQAEEIDARELPVALQKAAIFLAFRSYDPGYAVSVRVTKHDYEPVAALVIQHMHLDTQLPREGRAMTEAYLVVRNNDRQVLELELPPGAKLRAVRVGERRETPRKGTGGTVLVPLLSGLGKDQAFVVALAYDHDVDHDGGIYDDWKLVSPKPVGDVKSDLFTWRVFAPRELTWTSFGGSVTPVLEYRSWALDLLANLGPTFFRRADGRPTSYERLIDGYESPFESRRDGTELRFHGRMGSGELELSGIEPSSLSTLKLIAFLISLVLAFIALRLASRAGVAASAVFMALVLVLIAFLVPAGRGSSEVLNSILFGVLLAGLAHFVIWLFPKSAARADPVLATPDGAAVVAGAEGSESGAGPNAGDESAAEGEDAGEEQA